MRPYLKNKIQSKRGGVAQVVVRSPGFSPQYYQRERERENTLVPIWKTGWRWEGTGIKAGGRVWTEVSTEKRGG
jgi:hypothetical protein